MTSGSLRLMLQVMLVCRGGLIIMLLVVIDVANPAQRIGFSGSSFSTCAYASEAFL